MLAISLLRRDPFPSSKRILGEIALVGFLLVCLGNLSVVWAEQWVPSGAAALFVATAPFWVAFMERMRADGERMNARRVAGMLMGFAGVALLVTPGGAASAYSSQFVIGALAIQAGCVAWQYGTIRAKYNLGSVPPLMSSALQMLIGGIAVSAVGLAIGEAPRFQPSQEGIVALAYLSIFGAVLTYTAYLYALRDLPTSSVSIYAYVNPLVAVLLGWLILNEELTWVSVLAMCVILAGVGLVQTGSKDDRKTGRRPTVGK